MGDMLKKAPWVQLIWPLLVALVFYAYTANIQAEIRKQLQGYVTKHEFESWKQGHREWSEEVIRRLDEKLTAIERNSNEKLTAIEKTSQEINRLLLEERRERRAGGGL